MKSNHSATLDSPFSVVAATHVEVVGVVVVVVVVVFLVVVVAVVEIVGVVSVFIVIIVVRSESKRFFLHWNIFSDYIDTYGDKLCI